MKEKLNALWAKVVENKEIAIRIGVAVAGAVVGAVITTIVNNSNDFELMADESESIADVNTEE